MKKAIFSVFLLLYTTAFVAAQDVVLKSFYAFSTTNAVELKWTFSAGSLCSGTIIQRSEDGVLYQQIGEIPGVCGDITNSVSFQFTDFSAPSNQNVYYRLLFGGFSFSEILEFTHYDTGGESSLVFPNPLTNSSVLLSASNEGTLMNLYLFDQSGRLIISELDQPNPLSLSKIDLKSGIYFYKLEVDGTFSNGKFIVD